MGNILDKCAVLDRIKLFYKLKGNADLARFLDVAPNTVTNWYNRKSFDIDSIYTKCVDVNLQWLLTGNGSMSRNDKNEFDTAIISYDPTIGVPYYDVDFAAGFNLLYNDQTIVPTYNIIFQPFEDAQFWCNVTGRSMEPKLNPGDIIALKEIPSIDDILYGEIYAVVLKNMRTIKIIRKADDPDMLRFIPININNFDEQVFPKNNIEKVFVVMGCISKFS